MADSLRYALIADLFTALETEGSSPGTDIHLRVHALLQHVPADIKPEELKTLLAPLFCKNKTQQERFYQIFDASWARVSAVGRPDDFTRGRETAPGKVRGKRRIQTIWWITGAVLLLLAIPGIRKWSGPGKQADRPRETRRIVSLSVGEEGEYRFDTLLGERAPRAFSHEHPGGDSTSAGLRVDTPAFRIRYRGIRPGADSINLRIRPGQADERQHKIIFYVKDTSGIERAIATTGRQDCVYIRRALPYPRDLNRLLPPRPTPLQQFLLDYEVWIKLFLVLSSGLIIWLLAYQIERKRRKLIAEHQPNSKPPYSWNIVMDGEPELTFSEPYYNLLHMLRRRETDEFWRLDVPKTIHATIQKGGMPNFRYKQQTRPSEYLLLLDTQNARDHRAQLFNLLYKNFRSQEIIAERYYYDGDPRLCWNETRPKGITLRELQYHYPQSRLLLVGNGYQLLNPQTGRLAKWTHLLSSWNDRALLSPQPVSLWGRRERALGEQLHVLPAAISGLREAMERFDAEDRKETEITPHTFPDAQYLPVVLVENDLVKTLESAFGEAGGDAPFDASRSKHLLEWTAVCALYPELHWDLTLYLGNLLSTDDDNALLTAENIARLCRLSWFTEGEMPEDARKVLLSWLEENNPAVLLRAREGLHQLLKNNPPPENSAAYDDYAMNMAINEWQIAKDKRRKKELEKEIAARLSAGQEADFTVVKVLDRPRSPLDFVVPDAWRKFMYHKGSPLLGAKAWLWALPLWLVLNGLTLWWKPEKVECKGRTVFYREKEFCLKNFTEEFLMTEIRLTDALLTKNDQDLALCLEAYEKSFTDDRFSVQKTFADSSYSNVAQACFNAGTDYKTAGNPDSACILFELANFFNTSVSDTLQLWYVRKAAQACKPPAAGSNVRDIVLRGQMQDSITKGFIPQESFSRAIITAKGLPNGYLLGKGQFRVDVPGDWKSPVIITIAAPGYLPKTMAVQPGDFERNVVVLLSRGTGGTAATDTLGTVNWKTGVISPENPKMTALVDSILRINGITQRRFRIQIANVENVTSATTQGENYLLYSSKMLDNLSGWSNIGMIAHEVGHLVLGHVFNEKDASKHRQQEIEADRFMGVTLARMGATREETLSAFDQAGNTPTANYPPRSVRIQATAIAFDEEMQKMAAADGDGDGVPDKEDQCPKIKGTKDRNGCPAGNLFREHVVVQGESLRSIATKYGTDLQKLAVANGMNINEKPMAGKIVLIPVPEDTDGDGVPDNEDKCPNEQGAPENDGCPGRPATLALELFRASKGNYAKNIKAVVDDAKIVFTFDIPLTASSDVYDIELKTDSKSGVIPKSVEGTGKGFTPKRDFTITWYYKRDGYTWIQVSRPDLYEVVAKRRKSKP